MKNIVSTLAVIALLFSVNTSATAQEPVQKKKKAKTEKSCSSDEKKSCSSTEKKSCGSDEKEEKKGGCCSSKKAKETKS